MGEQRTAPDLLLGTLDLLILQALARGSTHGYGVAQHLRQVSEDLLQVGESSLDPALQRLLHNGWVKAEWGESENKRRARYYTLIATRRRQFASEHAEFQQIIAAIQRVLDTA
jgi:PadR family transcriptional regulator